MAYDKFKAGICLIISYFAIGKQDIFRWPYYLFRYMSWRVPGKGTLGGCLGIDWDSTGAYVCCYGMVMSRVRRLRRAWVGWLGTVMIRTRDLRRT